MPVGRPLLLDEVDVDVPLTRIDWVETQVRRAILDGDLPPGERLIVATLSERFSVSPTPLREALQRLAGEGLVEFAAQRGARVAPLSVQDRRELTGLRSLLEPETAAQAAGQGGADWVTGVRAASAALVEAWHRPGASAVASEFAYRAFYDAVATACSSARLRTMARVVRDQESRYRLAVVDGLDRDELAARHARLLAALLAGGLSDVRSCIKAEIATFEAAFLDPVPAVAVAAVKTRR